MGDQENNPGTLIFKEFFKFHWRGLFTFTFPIILSPILIINFHKEWRTLYFVFLLAGFWITQSIPFWVAGLLPVIYMPCMGIMDSENVTKQYLREPIMHVFLGYLVILSLEFSKLNKRCAIKILSLLGKNPRVLHFWLMLFSMIISMVISNAVTTALMCPIIGAILEEFKNNDVIKTDMEEDIEPLNDKGEKHPTLISMAYYIGIAYAANIGGCVTHMGSPTNIFLFISYIKLEVGQFDVTKYILWNILPAFIVFLFVCFFIQISYMGLLRNKSKEYIELSFASGRAANFIENYRKTHQALGPISTHEKIVVFILLITFILLVFLQSFQLTGDGAVLNEKLILASSPLALAGLILFALPINCSWCKHCFGKRPFPETEIQSTITWGFVNRNFPWGLLFLLGANFVIMEAVEESGLLEVFKDNIKVLAKSSNAGAQFSMILITMICTNVFSNATIVSVAVPVCGALAKLHRTHPIYFVVPVGVASSHAYHLKCSTPPNLIATSYGKMKTKYLAIAGIGPSVSALLVLFLMGQSWQNIVFPNSNTPP